MSKSPFGPRHRRQAVAMVAESNRRRRSVRIGDDQVYPTVRPDNSNPQPADSFLRSHSWVTVPPKAVGTERKSAGWKASDAAYFGSSVWDGVEPDRSHQRPGQTEPAGFTATVDNPDAKQLRRPGSSAFTVFRNGRVVAHRAR